MLRKNINNILYNLYYKKNYIENNMNENYIIAYNNTFVFATNKKIEIDKRILTSFARLNIKHSIYQTIKQNFPYIYEHQNRNYTFINNLFLRRNISNKNLLSLGIYDQQKKIKNRLFGWKSFFFSLQEKQDNFLNEMSRRLRTKKIVTTKNCTIWLMQEVYKKEKKQKLKKTDLIFSLK